MTETDLANLLLSDVQFEIGDRIRVKADPDTVAMMAIGKNADDQFDGNGLVGTVAAIVRGMEIQIVFDSKLTYQKLCLWYTRNDLEYFFDQGAS